MGLRACRTPSAACSAAKTSGRCLSALAVELAGGRVAGLQARLERVHPLGRASMREALRDNHALALLLEHVVADRLSRPHALFDVARLEDVALRITRVGCPD